MDDVVLLKSTGNLGTISRFLRFHSLHDRALDMYNLVPVGSEVVIYALLPTCHGPSVDAYINRDVTTFTVTRTMAQDDKGWPVRATDPWVSHAGEFFDLFFNELKARKDAPMNRAFMLEGLGVSEAATSEVLTALGKFGSAQRYSVTDLYPIVHDFLEVSRKSDKRGIKAAVILDLPTAFVLNDMLVRRGFKSALVVVEPSYRFLAARCAIELAASGSWDEAYSDSEGLPPHRRVSDRVGSLAMSGLLAMRIKEWCDSAASQGTATAPESVLSVYHSALTVAYASRYSTKVSTIGLDVWTTD